MADTTAATWPADVDPARWLLGACSSGDPLRPAVAAAAIELTRLRDIEQRARYLIEGPLTGAEYIKRRAILHAVLP